VRVQHLPSGYQEVLTDPSYAGQIVVATHPLIGNYGIVDGDGESPRPQVAGYVMRECVRNPSNWQASGSLPDWLAEHGVVAIEGIDTRELTLHLRDRGALRGVVTTDALDAAEAVERARAVPLMEGRDLTGEVTVPGLVVEGDGDLTVAALDFGLKQNIVRELAADAAWCALPADASPDAVLDSRRTACSARTARRSGGGRCDRDPACPVHQAPEPDVRNLLGHQLLALAHGGETYKLEFGHHGGNHPVQNLRTGHIDITSHNHGFAVREQKSAGRRTVSGAPALEITHVNLYDGTVEGFENKDLKLITVQFHPEAHGGPRDTEAHFFDALYRRIS
jgi:carbamoyl-phosphate synthase small subunit